MKAISTGKKKKSEARIKSQKWDRKLYKTPVDKKESFHCICYKGETPVTEHIAVASNTEHEARNWFAKRSIYAGYTITKVTPVPQQ